MLTKENHPVRELSVIGAFDRLIGEAIREAKPHWVVEVGNRRPLNTLYHGYLLSLLGEEAHTLVSVTPALKEMPRRRNIYYIEAGIGADLSGHLKKMISPGERVMVVLGEEDGCRNPLAAIQRYAPLVTAGSCLLMAGEIDAFATKHVFFEPDWTVFGSQVYLREGKPAWFLQPSPSAKAGRTSSAAFRN